MVRDSGGRSPTDTRALLLKSGERDRPRHMLGLAIEVLRSRDLEVSIRPADIEDLIDAARPVGPLVVYVVGEITGARGGLHLISSRGELSVQDVFAALESGRAGPVVLLMDCVVAGGEKPDDVAAEIGYLARSSTEITTFAVVSQRGGLLPSVLHRSATLVEAARNLELARRPWSAATVVAIGARTAEFDFLASHRPRPDESDSGGYRKLPRPRGRPRTTRPNTPTVDGGPRPEAGGVPQREPAAGPPRWGGEPESPSQRMPDGSDHRNPVTERIYHLGRHGSRESRSADGGTSTTDWNSRVDPRLAGVSGSGVRSVNTMIVTADSGQTIPSGSALRPATAYSLVVGIGPHHPASLLPEPDGRWPRELLPERASRLRVLLDMEGGGGPTVRELTVRDPAPMWGCDCAGPVHGPHCDRASWARFPLRTPDVDGVEWTGVLAVYFEAVAVHVQELTLPITRLSSNSTAGGVRARLMYRLTSRFDDIGPLSDRVASVFVPGGSGRAVVNALPFVDNPVSINLNAADNAARAARQLLYDQHLTDTPRGPRANADATYSKSAAQFESDLAGLARFGWTMYNRLFADNVVFDTMAALVRHEARARGHPPVLNIAEAVTTDLDAARVSIPWALVYDMPMPQDPHTPYRVCPSVDRFGPGGHADGIPAYCPEPDHSGNTLCPFGFWGLSSVLEQPPRVDNMVRHVHFGPEPPAAAVVVDRNLDAALTAAHLAELRGLFASDSIVVDVVRDGSQLAAALAGDWMDLAYLYCHGGYLKHATGQKPAAGLCFGDTVICEEDIAGWRLPGGPWPYPHWAIRKPLVVLNGCHTAEFTTSSLSNLVNAFVNRAGAAAVVGTEIAVEQGAAGWATRQLLGLVLKNDSTVGQAIRTLRWQLIGRGNTLGLAYTLYGVADLRLRP